MTKRSWIRKQTAPPCDPHLPQGTISKCPSPGNPRSTDCSQRHRRVQRVHDELDVSLSAADDQALISPIGLEHFRERHRLDRPSFAGVNSLVVQGANTATADVPNQVRQFRGRQRHVRSARRRGHRRPQGLRRHLGELHERHHQRDVGRHRRHGRREDRGRVDGSAGKDRAAGLGQPLGGPPHGGQRQARSQCLVDLREHRAPSAEPCSRNSPRRAPWPPTDLPRRSPTWNRARRSRSWGRRASRSTGPAGTSRSGPRSRSRSNPPRRSGRSIGGSALNPTDAAIAVSMVDSTAVAHVGGGSTVSAGTGTAPCPSRRPTRPTSRPRSTARAPSAAAAPP